MPRGAVQCPQCGVRPPSGQRFCGQCGARLPVACPACGRENPTDFRYCGACGTALGDTPAADAPRQYTPPHLAAKILTARSALEGERKQVTVLFVDVAGSTALAERIDPEEMHGIMDRCFRILMDEVHRYEGTINQFTGDGVMALFGAPIAHENAPERAVRAALGAQAGLARLGEDLARTRNIDFRVRMGLNSGPVVVGKIGDDLRMDYTAVGDTTNLAARLQAAAAPGTVLMSEQTAKLVAGRFATRPVGPLVLKGKSQPVTAFEVVRALPRVPLVAPSGRGLTPLVGRDAELAALERLWRHTGEGRGQMVFVMGEAGIGKSRLIYEFRRRLEDEDPRWLEGRCVSFSREIPFLPVIDLVKASFGIEESDDDEAIVAKIDRGLAPLRGDVASIGPYLRALLAVDPGDPAVAAMDASARRFATFEALKRLALALAAERPLVILIEDLHWIDQASDEYLTYVAEALAAAPILLLCTHRPGYRPPLGERSYCTRLALQPLTREETVTIAESMLEGHGAPAEIRALIAAKAEGNPFYAEEVTKSLLETGALERGADGRLLLGRPVSEIVVPDTIQDVIMARIDRLGEEPKRAIQVASVIGREFAVRLLQRASDVGGGKVERLVGELRALELIYEKSGVPEVAYMFKHALTHDVAYESMLMERRRALHRLIGGAVEDLYADRLPEYWETLAYHFERGEDWPRAYEYLAKAGSKALAAFANAEAAHFYARALEVSRRLDADPAGRAGILQGKARAHFALSEFPESVAAFREALALVDEPVRRARLEAGLAEALLWAHDFDPALEAAERARAGAEAAGAGDVAAHATFTLGFVREVRGELEAGDATLSEARRCALAAGLRPLVAQIDVLQWMAAAWRGEYAPGLQSVDATIALLRDANELFALTYTYSEFGIILGGAGRYARALALLDEGLALAESIGDRVWRARMLNTRGWIHGELGAFERAEDENRRSLEVAQTLGSLRMAPELIGNAEANLADLALGRGDLVAAEPHVAGVAGILADRRNEWMAWRYGMHYRASAAELALARGDVARAREHLAACLATAERTRSRRYLVRGTRLLAACHAADGDRPGAERLLARVVADARALGNPPQRWHALLAHARVLAALGRRDEAQAAAREAADVARAVRATLPDELGRVFERSAVAASLAELAGLSL
jgi:class 3 adenylate cyclase/tetratricopeptide (TPR) repeat protein